MVATKNVIVDGRVHHRGLKALVYHEVVKSPSNVPFPAFSPLTPPRVFDFLRVFHTESIDPSILQKLAKTIAFLDSESSRSLIALGSGNIDLLVTYVEVTT